MSERRVFYEVHEVGFGILTTIYVANSEARALEYATEMANRRRATMRVVRVVALADVTFTVAPDYGPKPEPS